MRALFFGLIVAWVLAGCAEDTAPVTRSGATASDATAGLLSAHEGGWPTFLDRLALGTDRDYVILAYVPPANPIDLSSAEAARGTMARLVFDQLGAMAAGTTIGHLIVGWQCDGVRGVASMTGEQEAQGQRMFLTGWGVTPVLSTFLDGKIVALDDIPARQNRALVDGRGAVVASQVSRAQCNDARDEVARFLTHTRAPGSRYSLVLEPAHYEGGGCLSFALHIAAQAGVMADLPELTRRTFDLRAVQLGARPAAPEGVILYDSGPAHPDAPVWWLELLTRRWDQGPVIDQVTVPDGEAIMAALVYARVGTAPANDWRYSRIMDRDDPVVGRAARHGLRWAYRYPVRRVADPDGVGALVLEHS